MQSRRRRWRTNKEETFDALPRLGSSSSSFFNFPLFSISTLTPLSFLSSLFLLSFLLLTSHLPLLSSFLLTSSVSFTSRLLFCSFPLCLPLFSCHFLFPLFQFPSPFVHLSPLISFLSFVFSPFFSVFPVLPYFLVSFPLILYSFTSFFHCFPVFLFSCSCLLLSFVLLPSFFLFPFTDLLCFHAFFSPLTFSVSFPFFSLPCLISFSFTYVLSIFPLFLLAFHLLSCVCVHDMKSDMCMYVCICVCDGVNGECSVTRRGSTRSLERPACM